MVDPDTGELIDAVTGEAAQMDYSIDDDGSDSAEDTNSGDGDAVTQQ